MVFKQQRSSGSERYPSTVTRIYTFEVEIPAENGGLKVRSEVLVNQTRAVDKIRLIKKLGHFSEEVMLKVDRALKLHYNLS